MRRSCDGCSRQGAGCTSTCDIESLALSTPELPHFLVPGDATGTLLYSKVPLSFWGGTHPPTGTIIDTRHDLAGESFAGKVLALPLARGSCTGSLAILECVMSGHGPAGIVLAHPDPILALGALVAGVLFGRPLPVVVIGEKWYKQLTTGAVKIDQRTSTIKVTTSDKTLQIRLDHLTSDVELSEMDRSMLRGDQGEGKQKAMELVLAMAKMYGAERLIDISSAHIDACIYVGPATLQFARRFHGSTFAVPTTLNAVSVDQRRWRELGVDEDEAAHACELADAYMAMGAEESFTCAPYLLPNRPGLNDQIGWGESNAVAFANSVIGARTQKYPDMLDVAVALTGRAPLAGCHLDEQRQPNVRVNVEVAVGDDSFWPLLGYRVGAAARNDIAIVCGLETSRPSLDNLKAFGAAYGTSSGSPMFHIRGVTPEAMAWEGAMREEVVTMGDLEAAWGELNSATDPSVRLVALGNPHASVDELGEIARLVRGKRKDPNTRLVITCARWTEQEAECLGYTGAIRQFGGEVLTDTCWCMIEKPIVPDGNVMTNSAKYAHYGPGKSNIKMHFGSLAQCVEAATVGGYESFL